VFPALFRGLLVLAALLALLPCAVPAALAAERDTGGTGSPAGEPYASLRARLGPPPALDHPARLGVVLTFNGFRYAQLQLEGMLQAALDAGALLECQAGATDSDEQGQRTRALELRAREPAALLVSPLTTTNLADLFPRAAAENVPVLSVDEAGADAGGVYVGADHYRVGALAAALLRERLPGGGAVAVLQSRETTWSSSRRARGFLETLPRDRFALAAQPECFGDMQTALYKTRAILRRRPDLAAVFSVDDALTLGAARAVQEEGAGDRVLVVGAGGGESVLDALRAGLVDAFVDCRPRAIGRAAMEAAVHMLHGRSLPATIHVAPVVRTREHPEGDAEFQRRFRAAGTGPGEAQAQPGTDTGRGS
jgi:ribose transport system substrate-binding protein